MIRPVLTHLLLGAVTLSVTAFWADGLLYIGKPVAEAVLTTEALQQALDEPAEPPEPAKPDEPQEPDSTPREVPAKDASRVAQDAAGSPPPSPQASSPAIEAKEGKQAAAAAVSAPGPMVQRPGEPTAAVGAPSPLQTLADAAPAAPSPKPPTAPMLPEQFAEVRQTEPVQPANSSAEGGLVSFLGRGLSGTASEHDSTGSSAGFVFEIRFASQLNWQTLQLVNGVLPVVVRQRRDFKEVALVMKDGRVSEPMALPELIQRRPEYEGCWAILLPRERLAELLEQTINHGYGWEPCCLVEDRRFSQWIDAARNFADSQRQTPDRIAGFQADALLVRAGNGADLQLVFRNLLLRETTP